MDPPVVVFLLCADPYSLLTPPLQPSHCNGALALCRLAIHV